MVTEDGSSLCGGCVHRYPLPLKNLYCSLQKKREVSPDFRGEVKAKWWVCLGCFCLVLYGGWEIQSASLQLFVDWLTPVLLDVKLPRGIFGIALLEQEHDIYPLHSSHVTGIIGALFPDNQQRLELNVVTNYLD